MLSFGIKKQLEQHCQCVHIDSISNNKGDGLLPSSATAVADFHSMRFIASLDQGFPHLCGLDQIRRAPSRDMDSVPAHIDVERHENHKQDRTHKETRHHNHAEQDSHPWQLKTWIRPV